MESYNSIIAFIAMLLTTIFEYSIRTTAVILITTPLPDDDHVPYLYPKLSKHPHQNTDPNPNTSL
eukprot:scaffold9616_cov96-Skeletonema_marinoi.AAC.4